MFFNIHVSFSPLFLLLQPLFLTAESCLSPRWIKVHENRWGTDTNVLKPTYLYNPSWLACAQQPCWKGAFCKQWKDTVGDKMVHAEFNCCISTLHMLFEAVLNLLNTLTQWYQSTEVCLFNIQRLVIWQP